MSGPYGLIVADPPWLYRDAAKAGARGAGFKYPQLDVSEIARLDVAALAAPNCALLLWAVPPMLGEALAVMSAWGFRYSTIAFVWVKTAPSTMRERSLKVARSAVMQDRMTSWDTAGHVTEALFKAGCLSPGLAWGMGQSTRANVDLVLLGTRGKLGRVSGGVHQVILAAPGRLSQKPRAVQARAVELLGERPRIELFARERLPGWHAWGNDPALGVPDVDLGVRPEEPDDDLANRHDARQLGMGLT